MTYRLRVPDAAADLIRSMHPRLRKKVRASLKAILSDPCSGKALKDDLDGLRSFRVSNFRIIYRVSRNKRLIEIVAVGPRKRIYEETFRAIKKEG
ncbi:MAG: type II toxin-antitoxin system RelE/ParE family toxin [Deltaproteobacteria bacterium]|nr:type II toxin-antitoxin system RelE/ParE family toxin [Deltaproteobacteria bacterium]